MPEINMPEKKQEVKHGDGSVGVADVRVAIALAGTELLFEERLTLG